MGAEGSKSTNKNVTNKHLWVTSEEQNILSARVQEITGQSKNVDVQKLKDVLSTGCGSALDLPITDVLTAMRAKTASRTTHSTTAAVNSLFTSSQLLALFIELLNPDPTVQAEVTIGLASGTVAAVTPADLLQHVGRVVACYCALPHVGLPAGAVTKDGGAAARVALAWLHDLFFDGASHKKTAGLPLPTTALTQGSVERWLLGHSALYTAIQRVVLRAVLAPALPRQVALMPAVTMPQKVSMQLSAAEVLLLNTALPGLLRSEWRLLFCNTVHGDSFSLLMKQIVGAGPTLVVVETEDGHSFGGFAAAPWQVRPQFHGTGESFLFSLRPNAGIYRTTGYNNNYQYLNYLHNNTMPNGLGMGGREELFGMFLSYDFGECTVSPTCSTFQCPPLCPVAAPRLRHLLVWGVGEEEKDSDDEDDDAAHKKRSALDSNPDARAMLDMIGRGRASDGLREPEPEED